MAEPAAVTRRVVLVGSGHSHLHLLSEWRRRPVPGVELTLVSSGAHGWHPGMMAGYLEGHYEAEDLRIDLAALARCAGARLIVSAVEGVNAAERIVMAGGEYIPFDYCSVDLGAEIAGADIPGVREHALSLRPGDGVVRLRQRLEALLAAGEAPLVLAVVGGGAAGVEIAFALAARMTRAGRAGRVMIVDGAAEILSGEPSRMRRRATELLHERGIGLVLGAPVVRVAADSLALASGATVPADLVVWAAGAWPAPLLPGDLPQDEGGLRVDRKLRAVGGLPVWGTGACISIARRRRPAPSLAEAVRQGRLLLRNLRAALGVGRSASYRSRAPRTVLLGTADGRALLRRGRMLWHGRWPWRLKERADRQFVARLAATCDERLVPDS